MCSVSKEEPTTGKHWILGVVDHLLMCSATIPLLASFDRGGNRDLKRLSNWTKVIIASKRQSLDLKPRRLAPESVC